MLCDRIYSSHLNRTLPSTLVSQAVGNKFKYWAMRQTKLYLRNICFQHSFYLHFSCTMFDYSQRLLKKNYIRITENRLHVDSFNKKLRFPRILLYRCGLQALTFQTLNRVGTLILIWWPTWVSLFHRKSCLIHIARLQFPEYINMYIHVHTFLYWLHFQHSIFIVKTEEYV